ncbi:cation diffusion facilitator family transporter [Kribbella sp. VKM Ac-2527]|uniref:Cation diffusion facilitator family transporter n=1 Tax=Kribbella caucasensis TaxID=2512215 RepID=A0A4R6KDP2_9ACTN|nr:cation diffusion facilitator family transporter [Kribbella sp. VKM Ac-2527]TDO48472.1 cation diffusion facilitator family transporter [Kribbella sp. VKM Ac-2527]
MSTTEHEHNHPHPTEHDAEHGHGHGHGHHAKPDGEHAAEQGHGHGHGHGHGDRDHGDHDHGSGVWAKVKHALVPHAHDSNEAIQSAQEASKEGIRTAWIGLAGMMLTALLQVVIVWASGSIALLADTLHNLGHAATTIPLVIAFKIGQRAASKRYPYGYRRAEDLVGLFISLVIAASAGLIIWESIDALVNPHPLTNLGWVFAAGIVGAAGNEVVAVYRIRAGKRIGSAALVAEGQHARVDGFTSIAVVLGVIGVWLGFARADAIVGLFIAVAILGVLVSSLRITIRRLMDGVDDGVIDQMTQTARTAEGVTGVETMRARWSGHRLVADAEITVEPGLSVADAHSIAEFVEHRLLTKTPHLQEVSVHVHPAGVTHPLTGSLV